MVDQLFNWSLLAPTWQLHVALVVGVTVLALLIRSMMVQQRRYNRRRHYKRRQ